MFGPENICFIIKSTYLWVKTNAQAEVKLINYILQTKIVVILYLAIFFSTNVKTIMIIIAK